MIGPPPGSRDARGQEEAKSEEAVYDADTQYPDDLEASRAGGEAGASPVTSDGRGATAAASTGGGDGAGLSSYDAETQYPDDPLVEVEDLGGPRPGQSGRREPAGVVPEVTVIAAPGGGAAVSGGSSGGGGGERALFGLRFRGIGSG